MSFLVWFTSGWCRRRKDRCQRTGSCPGSEQSNPTEHPAPCLGAQGGAQNCPSQGPGTEPLPGKGRMCKCSWEHLPGLWFIVHSLGFNGTKFLAWCLCILQNKLILSLPQRLCSKTLRTKSGHPIIVCSPCTGGSECSLHSLASQPSFS